MEIDKVPILLDLASGPESHSYTRWGIGSRCPTPRRDCREGQPLHISRRVGGIDDCRMGAGTDGGSLWFLFDSGPIPVFQSFWCLELAGQQCKHRVVYVSAPQSFGHNAIPAAHHAGPHVRTHAPPLSYHVWFCLSPPPPPHTRVRTCDGILHNKFRF